MTDPSAGEIEHDFACLDALAEQRVAASRAEVLKQAVRLTLAGGAACAMVLGGAALLATAVKVQVATVERAVQAPAAQIVEVPKLVSPEIVRPEIVRPEVAPRAAGEPERRPLADFPDRTLAGTITSADADQVCIRPPNGGAPGCVQPALVDANGKAILDAKGEVQRDPAKEYGPMSEAVGREAYQAANPADPTHLARYWWRQGDDLVAFNVRRARHANTPASPGRALPEVRIASQPLAFAERRRR